MADRQIALWNEEREQRKRALQRILITGSSFIFLLILYYVFGVDLSIGRNQLALGCLIGVLVAAAISGWLVSIDQAEWATHAMFIPYMLIILVVATPVGVTSRGMYGLFIPIVAAALLLPARWSLIYAALAVVVFVSTDILSPQPFSLNTTILNTLFAGGCFGTTAATTSFTARRLRQLLKTSIDHGKELERNQSVLEERVQKRTLYLEKALDELQRSSETIRQMSVPVLPIAERVLVLPLVGSIDLSRAALLSDELLNTIYQRRPHTILIDLTGLTTIDQAVAESLVQTLSAVRLLGTEPIVVGLRSETVQALLDTGIDISHIRTFRDVQSGLGYATSKISY